MLMFIDKYLHFAILKQMSQILVVNTFVQLNLSVIYNFSKNGQYTYRFPGPNLYPNPSLIAGLIWGAGHSFSMKRHTQVYYKTIPFIG